MNFKLFDNKIVVNYPDSLKGYTLKEINGININNILVEIKDFITYGTPGNKKYEIEKTLLNRKKLFGLPSLRNKNVLSLKLISQEGYEVIKQFSKEETHSKKKFYNFSEYFFGTPGEYLINNGKLIIINYLFKIDLNLR